MARYITHVTACGNTVTTPAAAAAAAAAANLTTTDSCDGLLNGSTNTLTGQHDVASEILSIGPIQLDDVGSSCEDIMGGLGLLQGGITGISAAAVTQAVSAAAAAAAAVSNGAVFSTSLQSEYAYKSRWRVPSGNILLIFPELRKNSVC